MVNEIRTGDLRGLNKGRSTKFRVGSQVRQHLKKAGGHIDRNVVEIIIKIKTIVRKPLMIKNYQTSSQKFIDKHLKKAGGHIGRNIVEITIKIKIIVRKLSMIKNYQASSQKFR